MLRSTFGVRQLAAALAGASWLAPRVGISITLGIDDMRQLAAALAGASWLAPRVGISITLGIDDMWQQAAASMSRL